MCGIAGIILGSDSPDRSALQRMVQSLAHRGPDHEGFAELRGCWLGHRRLSVIDIEGGNQPMTELAGRYHITFNGEIYNYRELRRELEGRGLAFRTQSDTEVLLRCYEVFGEQMIARLNGQFAFAVWDEVEQRLFAARDRLGEKPLYWARTLSGSVVFASELRAILASRLVRGKLNRGAVAAYLGLLYVPPNQSIYENIACLPPGYSLTVHNGQVTTHRYWQCRFTEQNAGISRTDAIFQVRTLLEQAVRRQMVADVEVGAFLSGGLDSSTVVALMATQSTRKIKTFCVGFDNDQDESPFARQVADRYATDHYELKVNASIGELLEEMAQVYDEPLGDSSNIPTFVLSRFVRQHVKVALSGDGGDELFGGYEWYQSLLLADRLRPSSLSLLADQVRLSVLVRLQRLGLATERSRINAHRRVHLRRHVVPLKDTWDRHLRLATSLGVDRSAWWGDTFDAEAYRWTGREYLPDANVTELDRAVDFDIRCYLPGDILVKVDRAAMANGLETRAPFLDVDLVEFVLSLPLDLRLTEGESKPLLRSTCENLWPDDLQRRGKQGFGGPLDTWTVRSDVEALWSRVNHSDSPLRALLPGLPDARGIRGQERWTLLCLGLWLERHQDCL